MRNFENRLESLKANLLEKYDCDIFIHTWEERGVTTDLNRLFPNGMQEYFQSDINSNPEKFIEEWSKILPSLDFLLPDMSSENFGPLTSAIGCRNL